MAPTLVASRTALPPEGANFPRGGPSENLMTPTLVTSSAYGALPLSLRQGAHFALGRPGGETLTPMLVKKT